MAHGLSEVARPITRFWQIHHPDGNCDPATTIILWLLCIISLTVSWTFLLGAEDIRRRLRLRYNFGVSELHGRVVGILGSLLIQLTMAIVTIQILRGPTQTGTSNASFGEALGA